MFDQITDGAGHLFGELTGQNRMGAAAKEAAGMAQFNPWNVNSPFGSVQFNDGTVNTSFNPEFQSYLDSIRGTSMGLMSQDGVMSPNQETATNELYGLLSGMAQPGEQRATNSMENKLFSRGMLGSTGGAELMGEFRDSLNRADMGRQVQAYQMATNAANSTANRQMMGANMGGMFGNLQNLALQNMLAGANIGGMQASAGANAGGFLTGAAKQAAANKSSLFGSAIGGFMGSI